MWNIFFLKSLLDMVHVITSQKLAVHSLVVTISGSFTSYTGSSLSLHNAWDTDANISVGNQCIAESLNMSLW